MSENVTALPSGAPIPLEVRPEVATPAAAAAPAEPPPAPAAEPVVPVETPVNTAPPANEPPPAAPEIKPISLEQLTEGRFKSVDEINAAIEAAKKIDPIVENIAKIMTDGQKLEELSPLFNELSVDYNKMPPIEIVKMGWEQGAGRFYEEGPEKEEAFEAHLRNEFSVTDPDDFKGKYGTSGDGWGKLNERADQYRTQFSARQAQTRQSLSEALRPVEQPNALTLTQEEIEAHMREYQSALQSFQPDFSALSKEVAPLLDTAPPADWLASTAKELAEAPNLMLDRYLVVENGVPRYNMKQILQDKYILDNYHHLVSTAATKSAQLGKGAGAAAIVQNLSNATAPTAVQGSDTRPKLPSGAPLPTALIKSNS